MSQDLEWWGFLTAAPKLQQKARWLIHCVADVRQLDELGHGLDIGLVVDYYSSGPPPEPVWVWDGGLAFRIPSTSVRTVLSSGSEAVWL